MSTQVLIYLGNNKHKEEAISKTLSDLSLTYRILEDQDLNSTIGHLFELSEDSETDKKHTSFEEDIMLFQDMEDETIIAISKALKELNANIERKAMLTEHNKVWTLGDLMEEIREEHAYFQLRDEVYTNMMSITKLKPEDTPVELQKIVLEAYEALQTETPPNVLQDILARMQAYMK